MHTHTIALSFCLIFKVRVILYSFPFSKINLFPRSVWFNYHSPVNSNVKISTWTKCKWVCVAEKNPNYIYNGFCSFAFIVWIVLFALFRKGIQGYSISMRNSVHNAQTHIHIHKYTYTYTRQTAESMFNSRRKLHSHFIAVYKYEHNFQYLFCLIFKLKMKCFIERVMLWMEKLNQVNSSII